LASPRKSFFWGQPHKTVFFGEAKKVTLKIKFFKGGQNKDLFLGRGKKLLILGYFFSAIKRYFCFSKTRGLHPSV